MTPKDVFSPSSTTQLLDIAFPKARVDGAYGKSRAIAQERIVSDRSEREALGQTSHQANPAYARIIAPLPARFEYNFRAESASP
jgi:hypothetical protein